MDIMQLNTDWSKKLLSMILKKVIKTKTGVNADISLGDLEIVSKDENDKITMKVTAEITVSRKELTCKIF